MSSSPAGRCPKVDGDKDYKDRTKLRVLRLLKDKYGTEEDFSSAELSTGAGRPRARTWS
jgi:hypothetical protein